jgi:hypothetical protein
MKAIRGHVFFGLLIWASLAPATAQALSIYNSALIQSAAAGALNDVVVDVESIAQMPEPRSIILLGTTLLIICGICRRRFRREIDEVR